MGNPFLSSEKDCQYMLFKISKYLFITYLLVSLFVYIFYIPPFEKPDENLHFLRAVSVGQGNFVCKTDKDGQIENLIPSSIYQYVEKHLDSPAVKVTSDKINEIRSCVLPFLYYLATGASVSLFKVINFSPEIIFYSGRLVNSIIASFIVFLSLRGLPTVYQLISLYVYSLPMVLYQVSSYSKDAYFISLGLYIFNRFLYFVINKKIITKDLIAYMIALILFILTRPSYIFFTLLSIIFYTIKPKEILKKHAIGIVLITIVTIFTVFSFFILNKVYITPNNTNFNLSYYDQIDPMLQFKYNIFHPFNFLLTLWQTILTFFLFYVKSSIGIFGWLDIPLPNVVYEFFIIVGFILLPILSRDKQIYLFYKWRNLLISIVVLTVLSLFSTMYLYSSPVGSPLIYGLQGRYFINLMPPIILLLAVIFSKIKKTIK